MILSCCKFTHFQRENSSGKAGIYTEVKDMQHVRNVPGQKYLASCHHHRNAVPLHLYIIKISEVKCEKCLPRKKYKSSWRKIFS